MAEKCFEFPAGNYEENRSLKRLIKHLSTYLNVPIEIEQITILRVRFNDNEIELEELMRRMTRGGGKARGRKKKTDEILEPLMIGSLALDPALDPLGS